jgi:hypothetical protein
MGNNRATINNTAIIFPTQLLEKGIPLPFLEGRFVVDQGWCAVITEGGAFKEILEPGTHFLGKYHMFRDVKATKVDLREKTLEVMTWGEFQISQPVPVEVDLNLSVEYRVSDARRVVTEVTTPLLSLYDRVLEAVRGSIVHANINEIRTQGEGIARSTLENLKAMILPNKIGIEVIKVLTTKIKATDTGNDAIGTFMKEQWQKVQEFKIDNELIGQTKLSPAWLAINRPELYAQIMAGNTTVLTQLIDKGLLDPAGFLNQPANASSQNPFMPGDFIQNILGNPSGTTRGNLPQAPDRAEQNNQLAAPATDGRARIKEEIGLLKKIAGATLDSRPGVDDDGIPDGTYDIKMNFPRSSGGEIIIYFTCPLNYPNTPPNIDVDLNDEETIFQSMILRRWNPKNYLVEIAREAKQFFG